jgi:CheY-like chemotaxis protein
MAMALDFPILIAEDSADDAELLRRGLERAGLNGPVQIVGDGHEAVEYLEGEGKYAKRDEFPFPKVIISDLKMPRVNGLELLKWLRSHPHCAIIPAILLSGSTLEADIMKAYQLGANTYFRKPTSFGELVDLLRTLRDYWERSELPRVAGSC